MKHDIFAKWLKLLVIGTGVIGLGSAFSVVSFLGQILSIQYPDAPTLVRLWQWTIYLCGIPCLLVLLICWKIAGHIQKGDYFCRENSYLFAWFSRLTLGDTIFFLATSIYFYFSGFNHVGYLFMAVLITFAGLGIFICTSALSYFTASAADLKEDSDLTI